MQYALERWSRRQLRSSAYYEFSDQNFEQLARLPGMPVTLCDSLPFPDDLKGAGSANLDSGEHIDAYLTAIIADAFAAP